MDVMRYDCKHTEKRQLKIATIASLCTTLHNCREEVCERDRKLREQSGDARKNEKSIKFHPPKNISQPIYTQWSGFSDFAYSTMLITNANHVPTAWNVGNTSQGIYVL